MVATIIPVCSSSSLQGDTSVVPTVDLNHSPSDVSRSILDPVSTNATKHPYLIRFQLRFRHSISQLIKSMNMQIKIQHISFEELLILTMPYPFTTELLLFILLFSLSSHHQDSSFLKRITYHPDPIRQTVYNSSVHTDTDPSIATRYSSCLSSMSIMNDILIIVQVSFQFSIIMNHHHHLCYLMFMILLEYNHHSLSRLLHWNNHSFNVTTIIDVIKYILQYIVWLKLIKNIKKMMTTIMIFGLILLYITTLSLTSTSTTMKRNIFYPYIVPCIDSSINSQNPFNKHSLIDSPIGVTSHFNHNPIQSLVIMLLNLCFVCNGIPDITVFSWIFLSILHLSGITFLLSYIKTGGVLLFGLFMV